ncbi:hypothetical protein I3842_01G108500 [Carya illinoinensis]|uniref:Uncharacterized protein n=1 Tax=Carya illinoinensis TaxID=32201 RepID=A0A922K353_CARIL|nr:hypothetical protein I3842_01G108500 [Carya illinoinensis]
MSPVFPLPNRAKPCRPQTRLIITVRWKNNRVGHRTCRSSLSLQPQVASDPPCPSYHWTHHTAVETHRRSPPCPAPPHLSDSAAGSLFFLGYVLQLPRPFLMFQ